MALLNMLMCFEPKLKKNRNFFFFISHQETVWFSIGSSRPSTIQRTSSIVANKTSLVILASVRFDKIPVNRFRALWTRPVAARRNVLCANYFRTLREKSFPRESNLTNRTFETIHVIVVVVGCHNFSKQTLPTFPLNTNQKNLQNKKKN
jgi:hypothetical protein